MLMSNELLKGFIISWGLVIMALALFYQYQTTTIYGNPILRPRLERIEPFQNQRKKDPEDSTESLNSLSPADASLENLRAPYSLLGDVLQSAEPGRWVSPNSQDCYDADFQKRLEMTGNFRQLTNNYKRAVPDSCSAPTHELVLNFYKTDPLPFTGCVNS
jgi:hypothetical protein